MPQLDELVLDFSTGGMNSAVNPASVDKNVVARMTNCRIDRQCPTTRFGIRFHALDGEVEDFRKLPLQGAAFYNPALGQSQRRFGNDRDSIVVAAGGQKLQVHVDDAGEISLVSNITGGRVTDEHVMLVHLAQAENYLIASDGVSDCWIWAGSGQAFFSTGYNTVDKEDSRLANGASLAIYAHGRIAQLVDGNKVLVGDIIHKNSQTSPKNILETTEQVYWATGTYFSAPSNLGEARAIALLPLRNTLHGHADVFVHYRNGIISLKLDHYPRSQWSELALSKHVLIDTGAQGPYAIALVDGDQFFRSRTGIQTLRSAAASSDNENNPQKPISGPVQDWLDNDYQAFLRFSEVEKWLLQRRVFATTGLWVESSWRGARGIVSLNVEPVRTVSQGQWAWEGLWTMPPGHESVVHMVNGIFNDHDRMFLLCVGREGTDFTNSLGEMRRELLADEMEDGSEVPISCQLITRSVSVNNRLIRKAWQNGSIYFSGITGDLDWGVWAREDGEGAWQLWKSGRICTDAAPCASSKPCAPEEHCGDLLAPAPQSTRIGLGTFPDELKNGRSVQFLIRWRGVATVEAMKVYFSDSADPGDAGMEEPESCLAKPIACDYDDFEYSDPLNRWEDNIPHG